MRLRLTGAVLVLLGLVAAGTAVASATLWRPADQVRAEAIAAGATTMLVTEPGVLELVDETVTVRATASGGARVVLAVGRDSDVLAWVGQDPHTLVTGLADEATLATRPGEPAPAAPPAEGSGKEAEAEPEDEEDSEAEVASGTAPADPLSSDMWLQVAEGEGTVEMEWTDRPGRWSLLVATTGEEAVSPRLELSWPREVLTPWLLPGSWTGGALVLAGAVLLVLSARRGREWVEVAEAEPAAAPSAPTTLPEGVPLTRRQLRELEARQQSARSRPVAHRLRRSAPSVASAEEPVPTAPAPAGREAPAATPGAPEPAHGWVPAPPTGAGPSASAAQPPAVRPAVPDAPPAARHTAPAPAAAPAPAVSPASPSRTVPSAATPGALPPATGSPSAAAEPATPAEPVTAGEPQEGAPQAPGPARSAWSRLRRRRHAAEPVEPPAPAPATEPDPEPAPLAPSPSRPTYASADAWRARWGFVEVPTDPRPEDEEEAR